jgi:hypothetical protein
MAKSTSALTISFTSPCIGGRDADHENTLGEPDYLTAADPRTDAAGTARCRGSAWVQMVETARRSPSTGFAVAAGTSAALQTQAAWTSRLSSSSRAPPSRLAGSGSDGVYYRPFDAASDTFGVPVLVSDETARTATGPTGLALARDASGGAYASWLDHRGYVLAYSADGGATWSTPAAVGLESTASDLSLAATGKGGAEIAYSRNPGSASQEYLAATSYPELAGG